MERKRLTKKERIFNLNEENSKDIIAYNDVQLYAKTDIPLHSTRPEFIMMTPHEIWQNYDSTLELEAKLISETSNCHIYTYCAEHREDGDLVAQISVYSPSFNSSKAVLLIGERDSLPQKEVIDAIVKQDTYVFTVDYNALNDDSLTYFPPSRRYGKHGNEGETLTKLYPSAKESCPYLYTLIHRRAVQFMKEVFSLSELTVVGIRNATEIAMQLAGTERERITALGCLCGAGYPEYTHIPRYKSGTTSLDDEKLFFIVGASGVSYLKKYPHPVFCAVGSNDSFSDVDRLSSLKSLIKGTLTVAISQRQTENIDAETFKVFLDWLNASFWKSDFPKAPESSIDIKSDGTVYASIVASSRPKKKRLLFNYSYNNSDHTSRRWNQCICETVGEGQYLAKLDFSSPCSELYFYTEATYLNGLVVTEAPKYLNTSEYRIAFDSNSNSAVLFRHGADGIFLPVSKDAVILSGEISEDSVPSGAKGTVCKTGSMRIFIGDGCKNVDPTKILQADCFNADGNQIIELEIINNDTHSVFRATKKIQPSSNFSSIQFSRTDFKDEYFRPLIGWDKVSSITVVTPNVIINKLMFI